MPSLDDLPPYRLAKLMREFAHLGEHGVEQMIRERAGQPCHLSGVPKSSSPRVAVLGKDGRFHLMSDGLLLCAKGRTEQGWEHRQDERARITRTDYLRLLALGVTPSRAELIFRSGHPGEWHGDNQAFTRGYEAASTAAAPYKYTGMTHLTTERVPPIPAGTEQPEDNGPRGLRVHDAKRSLAPAPHSSASVRSSTRSPRRGTGRLVGVSSCTSGARTRLEHVPGPGKRRRAR